MSGVALAAAPLPHTHKAYDHIGLANGLGLTLVISAHNPKKIESNVDFIGVSSRFSHSGGIIDCPKAPRAPGPLGPFAPFGFPGATLKLSHGQYGFSVSWTRFHIKLHSSSAPAFNLHLNITGRVVSSTEITGTFQATGGYCTTGMPIKYKLTLDKAALVGPNE
jgi:hypothetical protein